MGREEEEEERERERESTVAGEVHCNIYLCYAAGRQQYVLGPHSFRYNLWCTQAHKILHSKIKNNKLCNNKYT